MANFVFDDVFFVSSLMIIPLIALLASTLYFPFFKGFDPHHPPLEPSGESDDHTSTRLASVSKSLP